MIDTLPRRQTRIAAFFIACIALCFLLIAGDACTCNGTNNQEEPTSESSLEKPQEEALPTEAINESTDAQESIATEEPATSEEIAPEPQIEAEQTPTEPQSESTEPQPESAEPQPESTEPNAEDIPEAGQRCTQHGGYCTHFTTSCKSGYYDGTPQDCPLGRSGKCCLPNAPSGACWPKQSFPYLCPSGVDVAWCECTGKEPCLPACRFVGTRSEGWYDTCTDKLIKYEFCSKCTTSPLCDKIGSKSEGWYCDGALIEWTQCKAQNGTWSCIKSPENACP